MDKVKEYKGNNAKNEACPPKRNTLSHPCLRDNWYKAIIQSSPDGFLLIKHPEGNILDADDTFCDMLGYNLDELLSMKIDDIEVGFDEAPDTMRRRISEVEKTGRVSFETRHRRKNGKVIDFAVTLSYLDEGLAFGFHRDITRQKNKQKREQANLKQKEKALKEIEGRYRTLVDLGTKIGEAMVMLQDFNGKEGIHTYVSDQWLEITGYSREELLGMSFFDLIRTIDRRLSVKRHRQKMSGETIPDLFELTITHKDGKEIPIEVTSAVTNYRGKLTNVAYIRDITDRKQADKALKESGQRYHTLFENAPVAICEADYSGAKKIFDDLKKQGVKDFSAYFEKNPYKIYSCYTIPMASYINPKLLEIKGAQNVSEMRDRLEHACKSKNEYWQSCKRTMVDLAEGRTQLSRETRVSTIKGHMMTTQEHIIVAPGYEDTLSKVFIYYFDITDLKNKEKELREYQEQLEKMVEERTANLSEEIDRRIEFTKLLVHELKTPLTPMIAASEVLTHQKNSEFKIISQNLYEGACALNRRVDELLDIARGEIGMLDIKTEPCDIIKLVKKISDEMLYLFRSRNQTLALKIDTTDNIIEVDPERIRQVLVNFLDNAFKFTPIGGRIILRIKSCKDNLLFEVEDNGLGIPDNEKEQIFESYYSRKKSDYSHTGIGVGLTLAKMIIRLHGGEIGIRNAENQGSIFYFLLPLKSRVNA